jgi:hypothetical protein
MAAMYANTKAELDPKSTQGRVFKRDIKKRKNT